MTSFMYTEAVTQSSLIHRHLLLKFICSP